MARCHGNFIKYIRPFDDKWKEHRLHNKVDLYHSVIEFISNNEYNTDTYDANDSDDI